MQAVIDFGIDGADGRCGRGDHFEDALDAQVAFDGFGQGGFGQFGTLHVVEEFLFRRIALADLGQPRAQRGRRHDDIGRFGAGQDAVLDAVLLAGDLGEAVAFRFGKGIRRLVEQFPGKLEFKVTRLHHFTP